MNRSGRSPRNYPGIAAALVIALLWITGCASLFGLVTYYDPQTYKNLTDLKPEVMALYDTFATDTMDVGRVAAVRLKFAQAHEYEKGKGKKNKPTLEQVGIIQQMVERHIADRSNTGRWNETHLKNQKQDIGEAFDIAIVTERLKNKNE